MTTPELIIPTERVRDLTNAPRRLPIEVEGSVAYELVLAMWTVFNPESSSAAFDLGEDWFENVRRSVPDDLAEEIVTLGGPYSFAWLGISSLLLSAPHPHDPDHVYTWLEDVDEGRLRRWLIGYSSHDEDQSLIEQAAAGDMEAALRLLGEKAEEKPEIVDYVRWLVVTDDLPRRFTNTLKRFRSEVFSDFEDDFAAAIGRAAAARRAAPMRGDAKSVIEEVTSGLSFEIPRGVNRVILVPSVVNRPLSLIDVHRGILVVYYGIADEFINSDPEAPPSWLLRVYKALGDDKRLRIMRRLSEGEATLDELTEMLGLSKSTVHHHMSLLRGAGLVRVQMSAEESKGKHKTYSVREQSVADAGDFLDSYLRTTELEQRNA